ncbi:MAG: hypothetical protein AABX39_05830 [Nanoarchaeota archaeon]
MKNKEILEELSLGIRSFLEAKERSANKSIDEFDENRILEASFSRLFLSIEHICNAIVLFETGNYSKKHFGDLKKMQQIQQKYRLGLTEIYREAYTFRAYGDYRKFPEVEENFNRANLFEEIKKIEGVIKECIKIIKSKINLEEIEKRL